MRVEKFGTLGSMPVRKYFPFIALENSETSEFIAVQLYIPSSWQIEILCREDDTLSLVGGIADRDYGHWFKHIAKGEKFTTPKAVIATVNSLNDVCDKLVKAQSPDVSTIDDDMGIMFNEYCTTWGNPSLDSSEPFFTIFLKVYYIYMYAKKTDCHLPLLIVLLLWIMLLCREIQQRSGI